MTGPLPPVAEQPHVRCPEAEGVDLSKATPRPWGYYVLGGDSGTDPVPVAFLVGPPLRYRERSAGFAPEDAALIVHSVNMYNDMREAIWQALDDMADDHCVCEDTKQMLRAALAKATPSAERSPDTIPPSNDGNGPRLLTIQPKPNRIGI